MTPGSEADLSPLPALTTLLPTARAEFLAIADTHLVDIRADHAREFSSRSRQNERVAAALRVASGTGGGTVIHLGDLVQDYPESPLHEGLMTLAVQQWLQAVDQIRFTPGNTDVGDQHDPSSPAAEATVSTMDRFSRLTGACWTTTDIGPVRAIILAASLFNSGLEQEQEQWQWFEAELLHAEDKRVALFFHYPLFLRSATDPDIGHYDVVNEPARSRMIELIKRFDVEAVFTGHSHFRFFNRIGGARVHGLPSTSFTRPGFCELFSSAPPPDRGRDDVPKLGLLLARVHDDGIRIHSLRTGTLAEHAGSHMARPVASCVPKDIPSSRLGVVLRHPITNFADVPDVFPSVIRQPVRNDYPLLACLELGARYVSVSVADALDPALADRLQALRDEGVTVIARVVWAEDKAPELPDADAPVDELELVLLGRATPTTADLTLLANTGQLRPLVFSTLMRKPKGSAELPRWRYGMTGEEVATLDEVLAAANQAPARVLMHAGEAREVDTALGSSDEQEWKVVSGLDAVVPIRGSGTEAAGHLSEAFLAACAAGAGRFFADGLTELDRTLDLSSGLLDRACNPQPAFHALRILNSLAHADSPITIEPRPGGFDVNREGLRAVVSTTGADVMKQTITGTPDLVDLAEGVVLPAGTEIPSDRPLMWLQPVV